MCRHDAYGRGLVVDFIVLSLPLDLMVFSSLNYSVTLSYSNIWTAQPNTHRKPYSDVFNVSKGQTHNSCLNLFLPIPSHSFPHLLLSQISRTKLTQHKQHLPSLCLAVTFYPYKHGFTQIWRFLPQISR